MEEQQSIDLKRLIPLFTSNIKPMIIAALVVGLASFVFTILFIEPEYSASVSIYAKNTTIENQDRTYKGDLDATVQLIETYIAIIRSDTVLAKVSQAYDYGAYTPQMIRTMLSASATKESGIFKVTIQNTDASSATKLANLIAAIAPDEIKNYVEASSFKVVDYAKRNDIPVSPNYTKNTLFGAFAGFMLVLAFVFLKEFFDVRIKTPQDLEVLLDLPLLGVIPKMNVDEDTEATSRQRRKKYAVND